MCTWCEKLFLKIFKKIRKYFIIFCYKFQNISIKNNVIDFFSPMNSHKLLFPYKIFNVIQCLHELLVNFCVWRIFPIIESILSIKILKFIFASTIYRRLRAVHRVEEHPSPNGFAMVFQKAPFSSIKNAKNIKSHTSELNGNNKKRNVIKSIKLTNNEQPDCNATVKQSEGYLNVVIEFLSRKYYKWNNYFFAFYHFTKIYSKKCVYRYFSWN